MGKVGIPGLALLVITAIPEGILINDKISQKSDFKLNHCKQHYLFLLKTVGNYLSDRFFL